MAVPAVVTRGGDEGEESVGRSDRVQQTKG